MQKRKGEKVKGKDKSYNQVNLAEGIVRQASEEDD
jgi:hypothetical protein